MEEEATVEVVENTDRDSRSEGLTIPGRGHTAPEVQMTQEEREDSIQELEEDILTSKGEGLGKINSNIK